MISTRDHSDLPDVDGLRRLLQALAMLDAILSPEWEFRYYSFNSVWSAGDQMGSMRNGSGDDFFALFNSYGCFLKGFVHDAVMSPHAFEVPRVWPGIFDGVPRELAACLEEPAFKIKDTTFCIWRSRDDVAWRHGPIEWPAGTDPDGSGDLLSPLDNQPETYKRWAEGYYERPVDLSAVAHIFQHRPLNGCLISALNPDVSLADLEEDIREIGYTP